MKNIMSNKLKEFDIYKKLDDCCKARNTKFTFIGSKPDNLQLSNYINPLSVEDLILEIPKHDVYITASKKEAEANHVLKAVAIGLQSLYHSAGGSINEYCQNNDQVKFQQLQTMLDGPISDF